MVKRDPPEQPRLIDAPATPADHLAGSVERVTFHSEENGFSVLRVQVRGRRDLVTVVGHVATVSPGEFIQAAGCWTNDRVHGVQFTATSLATVAPTTIEGIEKYLASGLVKGIGAALREAARRGVRRGRVRRHRARAGAAAVGRGDRPGAGGPDHRRLARPEGGPRDHGLPALARRRDVARGAHLQDLRRRTRSRSSRRTRTAWPPTFAASAS